MYKTMTTSAYGHANNAGNALPGILGLDDMDARYDSIPLWSFRGVG